MNQPSQYTPTRVDSAGLGDARHWRAEEQWTRYDSVVIGPNTERTQGWFTNFSQFASASTLTWNDGSRKKSAGEAYTNQSGDTEDFAQLIYQSGVEFKAPVMFGDAEADAAEPKIAAMFLQQLPDLMRFVVKLQDVDNVLTIPGSHMPGGTGTHNQFFEGGGSLQQYAGTNGPGNLGWVWNWPEPLGIPTKSKLTVNAIIDQPLSDFFKQLASFPKQKIIVTEDGEIEVPNYYIIRVWHRGPRMVQLRGARSAS